MSARARESVDFRYFGTKAHDGGGELRLEPRWSSRDKFNGGAAASGTKEVSGQKIVSNSFSLE
jgi:hypothetical protein